MRRSVRRLPCGVPKRSSVVRDVHRCGDRCHDPDDAFAPFIHRGILSFRLVFAYLYTDLWRRLNLMFHALWAWHPPVGVWIGVLRLAGIIVPLVRDPKEMGKWEKATWTFVLFALLLLEMKTVYQD